jgi:hypothetical protein
MYINGGLRLNTIEVDDDVMGLLKKRAEPFVDTPNSVLRKLLGLDSDIRHSSTRVTHTRSTLRTRHKRTKSGSRKGERAPTGAILPEEEYVAPVLQVLHERGGSAPAREVIEEVGRRLASRLTVLDKEPVSSGGVRWQNRVQFARLRLLERGLLKRNSPRGFWEMTSLGIEQVMSTEGNGARQ